MNKPTKLDNGPLKSYQWLTTDEKCDPALLPPCRDVLVEVIGDLAGGDVVLKGGLTAAVVPLEVVRSTPALVVLPAVRYLVPDAPAGVTITVMGVL